MKKVPVIAVVGCGAVSDIYYLPILAGIKEIRDRLVLVDTDRNRLGQMANKYKIKKNYKNIKDVVEIADAGIIATPPASHFSLSRKFIMAKKSVLCEKPLTESFFQAKILVDKAKINNVNLLVNNTRRLYPSVIAIKKILDSKQIGEVVSVEFNEGGEFRWPTVSGFYFTGKRGVLSDRGVHIIDIICWWFGKPKIISYIDDSFGGAEAKADIKFKIGKINGLIKLNLLLNSPNNFIIIGTKGKIIGDIHGFNRFTLFDNNGRKRTINLSCTQHNYSDFVKLLLDNFIGTILGDCLPIVPIETCIESIRVIEECYRKRKRYEEEWM